MAVLESERSRSSLFATCRALVVGGVSAPCSPSRSPRSPPRPSTRRTRPGATRSAPIARHSPETKTAQTLAIDSETEVELDTRVDAQADPDLDERVDVDVETAAVAIPNPPEPRAPNAGGLDLAALMRAVPPEAQAGGVRPTRPWSGEGWRFRPTPSRTRGWWPP